MAANGAPYHTEISDERPHFDPIPVFIGPVAGWKGPVLGARPTHAATAGLPPDAKAYSAEKTNGVDDQASSSGELSAPTVLKGAVRTPAPVAASFEGGEACRREQGVGETDDKGSGRRRDNQGQDPQDGAEDRLKRLT